MDSKIGNTKGAIPFCGESWRVAERGIAVFRRWIGSIFLSASSEVRAIQRRPTPKTRTLAKTTGVQFVTTTRPRSRLYVLCNGTELLRWRQLGT
ncbi:MAG: hypothetical protein FWD31_11445, partial [Planctomycetaceae bacterium]|nr:hypothetical protein [Planctomycetaceae bacterium]